MRGAHIWEIHKISANCNSWFYNTTLTQKLHFWATCMRGRFQDTPGGRIFGETVSLGGWGAFLSRKMLGLDGWHACFSIKSMVSMARARISQENAYFVWQGRTFFQKMLGTDGLGMHFSRKIFVLMVGRVFFEKKLSQDGWGLYFSRKSLL
jgi:hypothetical protein